MILLSKAAAALVAMMAFASPSVVRAAGVQTLGPTKPSELVTVQSEDVPCSGGSHHATRVTTEVTSNGAAKPFHLAKGFVLVVTNVQFRLSSSVASQNVRVQLGVPCGAGCTRPLVEQVVATDSSGGGGAQVSLGNGIVIARNVEMCVSDVNFDSLSAVTIHGYIAANN